MDKKVKLSIETARELYKQGGASKLFALDNYKEKELLPDVKDRINSYEDACEEKGYKILSLSDFNFLPISQRERAFYTHQLEIIIECFNEGWIPDWKNSSQYKYYNYFERKSSGWGVYGVDGGWIRSCPGCSFYFKNKEDAECVGKKFINIYSKILG